MRATRFERNFQSCCCSSQFPRLPRSYCTGSSCELSTGLRDQLTSRFIQGDWTVGKGRLEAFSDGVLAIIITIMVLEMKVPHGTSLETLTPLLPVFLSYVLSSVYVGIYWNNHHHMLHTCTNVSGRILWANLHLLFWLS